MTLRPALLLVPMLLLACPAQAQHARLTGDSPVQTTPPADSDDAASSAQAVPATAVAMDSTLLAASPAVDEDASTVPPPLVHSANPPAPAVVVAAPVRDHAIGDATRRLLKLQASGTSAAPVLPQLGQSSGAAYQRYMKSFEHAIPVFFDSTVPGNGGGSSR